MEASASIPAAASAASAFDPFMVPLWHCGAAPGRSVPLRPTGRAAQCLGERRLGVGKALVAVEGSRGGGGASGNEGSRAGSAVSG